jgi:hypothetical protein
MRTSPRFFTVLGVAAALGRTPTGQEEVMGGPPVVVISDGFWRSRFNADPGVVGRPLVLSGVSRTIAGVMPPSFSYPREKIDLWQPIGWAAADRGNVNFRRAHWVRVVARLKPGVRLAQASAELNTRMYSRAAQIHLDPSDHLVFSATSLWRYLSGMAASVVLMFFAFSACLLALVAANLSNLLRTAISLPAFSEWNEFQAAWEPLAIAPLIRGAGSVTRALLAGSNL